MKIYTFGIAERTSFNYAHAKFSVNPTEMARVYAERLHAISEWRGRKDYDRFQVLISGDGEELFRLNLDFLDSAQIDALHKGADKTSDNPWLWMIMEKFTRLGMGYERIVPTPRLEIAVDAWFYVNPSDSGATHLVSTPGELSIDVTQCGHETAKQYIDRHKSDMVSRWGRKLRNNLMQLAHQHQTSDIAKLVELANHSVPFVEFEVYQ